MDSNIFKSKNSSLGAYSLIEVSLLVILIGVLVAGIYQGNNIYQESVLSRSQSLTQNSIIGRTSNVLLWYETTLDSSFNSKQRVDNQPIHMWLDNNSKSVERHHALASQKLDDTRINYEPSPTISSSGPIYIESGINYLPSLKFKNNSSLSQFLVVDPEVKFGNSSLNIFIVIRFKNYSSNTFVFDRVCVKADGLATSNESLAINQCKPVISANINNQNLINFSVSNIFGISSTTNNSSQILTKNLPYIIQFERELNQSIKFYINGRMIASAFDNLGQFDSLPLKIGRHATLDNVDSEFDISEIVVIEGKIENERKKEIENYLSKKFAIKLDR